MSNDIHKKGLIMEKRYVKSRKEISQGDVKAPCFVRINHMMVYVREEMQNTLRA
jgi:hypothetical protein